MSCPEFEKHGILYQSGELPEKLREDFEEHLSRCEACQEQMANLNLFVDALERLPLAAPDAAVRRRILKAARRQTPLAWLTGWIREIHSEWFARHPVTWGLSLAGAAIVLVLLVVYPFKEKPAPNLEPTSDLFAWQDDFLAEASFIEDEIDRVESGNLLVSYTKEKTADHDRDSWASPLSPDLDWVRSQVEGFMKNVYGI